MIVLAALLLALVFLPYALLYLSIKANEPSKVDPIEAVYLKQFGPITSAVRSHRSDLYEVTRGGKTYLKDRFTHMEWEK